MLHSAHKLGISLSVFSSQQQAEVVCAVNLRGTCCTNFMRGQQKQERVITSSSSNVKTCGCVKKNIAILVRAPLVLVILPSFL